MKPSVSIQLAKADHETFGGSLAGKLIAASPIQVCWIATLPFFELYVHCKLIIKTDYILPCMHSQLSAHTYMDTYTIEYLFACIGV